LTVYKADGLGQVPIGSTVKIYYYIQQGAIPDPSVTEPTEEPTGDGSIPIPVPSFTVTPLPTATPTEDADGGN
jgi:hypothetical protein